MRMTFTRSLLAPLLVLVVAAGASVHRTAYADEPTDLDEAFATLRSYEFGTSRATAEAIAAELRTVGLDQGRRARIVDGLTDLLRENSTDDAKAFALEQLARVGGPESVNAITPLVRHDVLAHRAIAALSVMGRPGLTALRDAVPGLDPAGRVQIAVALGTVRDPAAVTILAPLCRGADRRVRAASIRAIGRIGTVDAGETLLAVATAAPPEDQVAVFQALLEAGDRRLAAADMARARRLVNAADELATSDAQELAVVALRAAAARPDSGPVLAEMLQDGRPGWKGTAIERVRTMTGTGVTESIVDILPTLDEETRVSVIAALEQRADPAARPAMMELAERGSPAERKAAVAALGTLGDPDSVPLLVGLITGPDEELAGVARTAVIRMPGSGVEQSVADLLTNAPAEQRPLLLELLAARGDPEAVPAVFSFARSDDTVERRAAIRALGSLAGTSDLESMADLVVAATEDEDRALASDSLRQAALREPDERRRTAPIVSVLNSSVKGGADGLPAQVALISVLGDLGGEVALSTLGILADRDALRPSVADALAGWPDASAMPALWDLVRRHRETPIGPVAYAGLIRLIPSDPDATAKTYETLLGAAATDEERVALLQALPSLGDASALPIAESSLDDPALADSARDAIVEIARTLPAGQQEDGVRALQRLVEADSDPALRRRAGEAASVVDATLDRVLSWEVAGPYTADGVPASRLMDTVFAPEKKDAEAISWRELAVTTPAQPGLADLSRAVGGTERCAYLRTRIHAENEQAARLELGTDDGVKVWLNDEVVHANNAMRGVTPGEDVVPVTLQEGWNTLLLKVIQGGGDWGAICRLRDPDGFPLRGVSAIAAPGMMAPPPDAVTLMDGTSLDRWVHDDGAAPAWRMEDGVTVVKPGSGSIRTRDPIGDCTLFVEFMCPQSDPSERGQARGNSGVYLQGRYEVQILDSWGESPSSGGGGSIYGRAAPIVNAARRPGEWQWYRIDFTAPRWSADGTKTANARMTVWQNGVRTHDDVEIEGKTGAGADEGPESASLVLQDHGDEVRFRSVWMVPRTGWEGADASGFTPLIDGAALEGWTRRGGEADYIVEDGAIVGRSKPNQPNTFLCTNRTFDDFVLELEFKVHPELNSGVQIRSESDPAYRGGAVHGYQVEIDPSDRAWSAGIYDESRRGWLAPLDGNDAARNAFRPGAWNRLRVEARGPEIRTWINGVPAARLWDDVTPAGFIGLQVHGVGGRDDALDVRWRDVRVRELN